MRMRITFEFDATDDATDVNNLGGAMRAVVSEVHKRGNVSCGLPPTPADSRRLWWKAERLTDDAPVAAGKDGGA